MLMVNETPSVPSQNERVKIEQRSLAVRAGVKQDSMVRVEWRLDAGSWKGVINVQLTPGTEDGPAIAELCALRYLIVERTIFGSDIAPRGTNIFVSAGAIRKLLRQETQKGHLVPYGRFMFASLEGCDIAVVKDDDFKDLAYRVIDVDGTSTQAPEVSLSAVPSPWPTLEFKLLNLGVGVTRHALERYQERFSTPYVRTAMNGLRKMLASDRIRELDKSETASIKARIKHHKAGRLFFYEPSQTTLVMVEEEGALVIATVYREEFDHLKEAVYVCGRVEIRNKK